MNQTRPPEPESTPPSPIPKPVGTLTLTQSEYLVELAHRLEVHAENSVIGLKPKSEIRMAAKILRQYGERMASGV